MNVFVLRTFHRAIRLMKAVPKIFHKHSVNAQNRMLVALRLHHIPHCQRSNIAAVFEISRIQCLLPHLVEDLASLLPCRKHRCRCGCGRSRDVFVFVVFLGSADDRVLRHVFHRLRDFGLRQGNVDDHARAVLEHIFFAALRGNGGSHE